MPSVAGAAGEALNAFFQYLRGEGFPCGAGERVKASLIWAAASDEARKSRLKTLLCPIFARGEADQRRFYQAFDLFFSEGRTVEPQRPAAGERPLSVPPLAQRLRIRRQRSRRTLILSGVALTLILAVVFDLGAPIRRWLFPPKEQVRIDVTLPPAVQPDVQYRSVPVTKLVPYSRTCRGTECLVSDNRWIFIIAPAVLALALAALARTTRFRLWLALRQERRRKPPFTTRVLCHAPPLHVYTRSFERTAEAMRQRVAGEERDLDVPGTVDATIRAAGFPTLRLRRRKSVPDYLFLIERRSPEDHLAMWWRNVARSLRASGVGLSIYYYSGGLARCVPEGKNTSVSTRDLLDTSGRDFVFVVGRAGELLNPYTGELRAWIVSSLVRRDHRALLTPRARFEWGPAEGKVGAEMPVYSARLPRLATAVAPSPAVAGDLVEPEEMPRIPPAYFEQEESDAEGEPPALSLFLDDEVFHWLCACAVYPRLEWELTLHLGTVVDPSGQIFAERKLLQLLRIDWFREGRIPHAWRAWLVKSLNPQLRDEVRRFLLRSLESNPAPKDSFAAGERRLQIAAQRYWLEPDGANRAALEAIASSMARADIADDPMIGDLLDRWREEPVDRMPAREWWRFATSGWKYAAAVAAATIAVGGWAWTIPVTDVTSQTTYRMEEIPPAPQPPRTAREIYVLLGLREPASAAEPILGALAALGAQISVPTYRVKSPRITEIRYAFDGDREFVAQTQNALKNGRIDSRVLKIAEPKAVPGRLEVWAAGAPPPQTAAPSPQDGTLPPEKAGPRQNPPDTAEPPQNPPETAAAAPPESAPQQAQQIAPYQRSKQNDSAVVITGLFRCPGHTDSPIGTYYHYLRFYENRTVIGATTTGTPAQIRYWFQAPYSLTGEYTATYASVKFTLSSKEGSVDYEGTWNPTSPNLMMDLRAVNKTTRYEQSEQYRMIPASAENETLPPAVQKSAPAARY